MTKRATEISSTIIKTNSCKAYESNLANIFELIRSNEFKCFWNWFCKVSRLSGPGISHSYNELLFVLIVISCHSYKTYKHPSAGRHWPWCISPGAARRPWGRSWTRLAILAMAETPNRRAVPSGHDEQFVNPPDEDLHCIICFLPSKEPVLTRCGHRFCRECLEEYMRRYS